MKSTGITRKIDQLGRIVIPAEIRKTLEMEFKTRLEIKIEGEKVILSKYKERCAFCNSTDKVSKFRGKNICEKCIEEIS